MKRFFLALVLFVSGECHAHHMNRLWTDERGRKTKAELLNVKEEQAILLMPDGREIPYPIEKLSHIDQAFVKKFLKEEAEAKDDEDEPKIQSNFESPWPGRVSFKGDPEITIIKENAETGEFVYESANYRYNCDVRLSKSVVKGFAVMFEATHQYTRELPLAINGGKQKNGKYQIILTETRGAYEKLGGSEGSAGVYLGAQNTVLVPLTSLGVRKVGSGYMLDRDKSSKTLPHELVHQLTPHLYFKPGARGWFTEGIAEYVAVTPYRSGSYNVRSNFRPFLEYVTAYGEDNTGGKALGTTIHLGNLKRYMLQPYSEFTGSRSHMNYGCGLLISNYFFHMDRKGDGARIKKFLAALRDGKEGEEALEALLDGQTFLDLEKEIAEAYSRKGIDFIFTELD